MEEEEGVLAVVEEEEDGVEKAKEEIIAGKSQLGSHLKRVVSGMASSWIMTRQPT